jgi:hypothetical protein
MAFDVLLNKLMRSQFIPSAVEKDAKLHVCEASSVMPLMLLLPLLLNCLVDQFEVNVFSLKIEGLDKVN